MVMLLTIAISHAGPVICDPVEALRLVDEARIDPSRVPLTHPGLIPGLARAEPGAEPSLILALDELCSPGAALQVREVDRWDGQGWSAVSHAVARTEVRGCSLIERSLVVTVGVGDGRPRYALASRRPVASTPIGDCEEGARFWQEDVLERRGPVVLLRVFERGPGASYDALVARRASPAGWIEQVIAEPSLDGARLAVAGSEVYIVVSPPGACGAAVPAVWSFTDRWQQHVDREALNLLVVEGLWREAEVDGWMVVLGYDDEGTDDVVAARLRRMQRTTLEPLVVYPSSHLPGFEPGQLLIAMRPFASRAEALRNRRGRARVRLAWESRCQSEDND